MFLSRRFSGILFRGAAVAFMAGVAFSCTSIGPSGGTSDGPAASASSGGCAARPPACLELALAEKDAGRTERASAILESVRSTRPGSIWAARAGFLLGTLALDGPAPGPPAPWVYFREVDRSGALAHIGDYVLLFQGRALDREGAHAEAAEVYRAIEERFPGSVLKPEAAFSRATALVEAGELREARERLMDFAGSWPDDERTPDALVAAARASVALGEPEGAEGPVKRLFVSAPAHEAADMARDLVRGEWKGVVREPELTSAERYTRALRFFESARFDEAAELFGELARDRKGGFSGRAALKEADSLIRIKKYGEAEKALGAYLAGMDDDREGELEALYLRALVAARQGHTADLVAMERTLAARYPVTDERARVLLFTARHFEGSGDPATAARYYKTVTDDFARAGGGFGWAVDEALWGTAWMAYSSGDTERAYRIFSTYGDIGSGRMAQRFLYWTGRTAEDTGRADVALGSYASICDEHDDRGYYCLMATGRSQRLGSAAGGDAGGPVARASFSGGSLAAADPAEAFLRDPHYLAASELITLGLGGLAAREIESLAESYSGDAGALGGLAAMFYEAGDYYRALRVYRRHLYGYGPGGRGGTVWPGGLTHEELSFPSPLVERIRRIDGSGRADPFLVAAVIREESTFNPGAVSRTGAVGLMQIMPSTGRYIAERLGQRDFKRDDLLDPETNIRFGAWYLGHLAKMFDGRVVPTVAGYNAGPGAASRWLENLPSDTDVFIESIPYPETRAYAKRVLSSYSGFMRNAGARGGDIFVMP